MAEEIYEDFHPCDENENDQNNIELTEEEIEEIYRNCLSEEEQIEAAYNASERQRYLETLPEFPEELDDDSDFDDEGYPEPSQERVAAALNTLRSLIETNRANNGLPHGYTPEVPEDFDLNMLFSSMYYIDRRHIEYFRLTCFHPDNYEVDNDLTGFPNNAAPAA